MIQKDTSACAWRGVNNTVNVPDSVIFSEDGHGLAGGKNPSLDVEHAAVFAILLGYTDV